MTGWQVFGMVLLPVALVLMAMANEKHREEHGIGAPSRKAMARIRRNARRKGVSTGEAYETWLHHKQRQAGIDEGIPSPAVVGPSANVPSSIVSALPRREPSTIREWRRASRLTLREIADGIGLPEHVVYQLDNGTRTGDAKTVEQMVALMREARDALPEPLPFEDMEPPVATVVWSGAPKMGTGGYVAGHFRKNGTWVKPHWRKPRGGR